MQNIKMARYSGEPRNRMFVKGYELLSVGKTMGKNIVKNISKTLSGKYSQKPFDHAKLFATDVPKASSKRVIKKTAGQLVIWLVIKLLIRSQKFQKTHSKIT